MIKKLYIQDRQHPPQEALGRREGLRLHGAGQGEEGHQRRLALQGHRAQLQGSQERGRRVRYRGAQEEGTLLVCQVGCGLSFKRWDSSSFFQVVKKD